MNENNEIIHQWIERADHDLGSAKIIFLHLPDYFDTIAFHCQQAVEKYLKAILLHKNISFIRTHDLVYLLNLLESDISIDESIYDKALILNSFSVEIRYSNSIQFLSNEELELSISIAEFFREFTMNSIL